MAAEVVFAMYRPFALSHVPELKELIRKHNTTLRVESLITERPAMLLQSDDGSFIEIFEWNSSDAAKQAHDHPAIQKIWKRMEKLAEFAPLISLSESERPFPHFKTVDGVVT